jgi:hypothetical protein
MYPLYTCNSSGKQQLFYRNLALESSASTGLCYDATLGKAVQLSKGYEIDCSSTCMSDFSPTKSELSSVENLVFSISLPIPVATYQQSPVMQNLTEVMISKALNLHWTMVKVANILPQWGGSTSSNRTNVIILIYGDPRFSGTLAYEYIRNTIYHSIGNFPTKQDVPSGLINQYGITNDPNLGLYYQAQFITYSPIQLQYNALMGGNYPGSIYYINK